MQKEIHPKYNPEAKVTCACGNTFTVGSTLAEINVEICAGCHPFFTGNEKVVDTAGRVEKFKDRAKKAVATPKAKKVVKKSKSEATAEEASEVKA